MSQEQKIQKGRILSRVDTVMGWTEKNPQLLDREIGYERETGKYKIGDGNKNWNQLEYAKGADIDPDFVTNVLSELENKSNKDHTHELAGYGETTNVSLIDITIMNDETTIINSVVGENYITSGSGRFTIDFQGYAELVVSYEGEYSESNNCYADIRIDGEIKQEWANVDTRKFTYKGVINNNIEVVIGLSTVRFEVFKKHTDSSLGNGFMSGEDKKKIDNIYIDENNNTGFGNIDTLEFNASNGFGTGTNNIIGSKAFNILTMDATNHTFTLDSVEGLEVGDIFTVKFKTNYNDMAKITAINENIITTSALSKKELSNLPNPNGRTFRDIWTDSLVLENGEVVFGTEVNSLRVNTKPQCGTKFFGTDSFVEGCSNIATGDCAHAEGYNTQALGRYAHAEGLSTIAYYGAHSEGKDTKAIGDMAHAEGQNSKAVNLASHAEGSDTLSSGGQAHAEGWKSKATGPITHAEGQKTEATGLAAHAEGDSTVAGGNAAHAEGFNTQALGGSSHAEGWGTIANAGVSAQHVQGRWNEPLSAPYVHIVGHGTSDTNRKNIHTLDWNGNAWYEGNININGLYIDTSGEAIPGQKIGSLTNLSSLTSGKIDINYFIDDVAFEPDTIYNKKTTAKYFGYLDVDNSNNILSDGMYLLVYDMEILSSPNPESIVISGQNTNLSNKRVGGTTYINSKFTTEKYNHIYYPFTVDNSTYKKYGVYYTDKSANGVTNECSYKIHNIGLYKLNELTTNINSFKIGIDDNGNIITTLNDSTKRNILLDIDVTPSMAIYNDGTKNLIALLDAVSVDNTVIYTSSISEINNIKNIGVMAGYSEETHAISYLDLPITINGEKIKYPNRQDLCQENSNIFIECEGYAEFYIQDTTLYRGAHTEFYIDDILLEPYRTVPWIGDNEDRLDRWYRFKGNINSGIVIKTFLNPNFSFYDFFKRTYTKGLISGIDKEKLDNTYTKEEVDNSLGSKMDKYIETDVNLIEVTDTSADSEAVVTENKIQSYAYEAEFTINVTGNVHLSGILDCIMDSSISIDNKVIASIAGDFVGDTYKRFTFDGVVNSGIKWRCGDGYIRFDEFVLLNEVLNNKADRILASYSEPVQTSLLDLNFDLNVSESDQGSNITANGIVICDTSDQGSATLYVNGYVEFEARCYSQDTSSPTLLVNGVDLCEYPHNWEDAEHTIVYKGYIDNKGIYFTPNSPYASLTFNYFKVTKTTNGLMSGADKEKLDNTYIKEEVDEKLDNLEEKVGSIDTALDEILKIQNVLIGGAN